MTYKLDQNIEDYILSAEYGDTLVCDDQIELFKLIRNTFEVEDIHINKDQLEKYLGMTKYFDFEQLFPWQRFFITLHLCTYNKEDGMPRWPDAFALIARGAGKDGTIAMESMMLTSQYNGIKNYNVDICANNEEQAMRPFKDLWEVFESPRNNKKMQKHYRWNLERAISLKTNSEIKGRTNSPKGKDGLRSGVVVFNEIHQYENYDNINVFTTGLGKKPHPRRSYYTTNGDVRGGPLDDLIEESNGILRRGDMDNGLLPFVCRLNKKEDVHDPKNWQMANPSLPYLPSLMKETEKEYREWARAPHRLPAFMTKRMNIPQGKEEMPVTTWENIIATNRELPEMSGWSCVVGIDYAKVTDFASVNYHFRNGDERFDVNHSWLCLKSGDLSRIKAPWRQWANEGLLTLVDDVEISPSLICEDIAKMGEIYNILGIALDNFRYALMTTELLKIGFDAKDYKNVRLLRPSDIMKTALVVDSCFANHFFCWGDNPVLRWATNNTKMITGSSRAKIAAGADSGNYTYGKIEGKSRKTDPFMGLVASMAIEEKLGIGSFSGAFEGISVFTF